MEIEKKKYDIAIIGAGITGLATAYHLNALGISDILIFDDGQAQASSLCPGVVSAGLTDNYTRLTHVLGRDDASQIWQYSIDSFELFDKFALSRGAAHYQPRLRRLRLVQSEAELAEVAVAVSELNRDGFQASLHAAGSIGFDQTTFGSSVLGIQDDGNQAALIQVVPFLAELRAECRAHTVSARVRNLAAGSGGMRIASDAGEFYAEMVVCAGHLAISDLIPELREALVSYADQWIEAKVHSAPTGLPQVVFSANHGYEWGAFVNGRMFLGGARFMRKHAGIGAASGQVLDKISDYLLRKSSEFFPDIKLGPALRSGAGLECRPCDELPLIGPMYGNDRVLLATGYMGYGLALGFKAGADLAQIILHGRCPSLPTRLHPKRLRSLEP